MLFNSKIISLLLLPAASLLSCQLASIDLHGEIMMFSLVRCTSGRHYKTHSIPVSLLVITNCLSFNPLYDPSIHASEIRSSPKHTQYHSKKSISGRRSSALTFLRGYEALFLCVGKRSLEFQ